MSSSAVDLLTITTVDLRLLSQSDLYALSLSSSPSTSAAAVVVPQINRSVFNESAGSRKQTFSRLRLAPRNPHSSVPLPKPSPSDPESAENSRIVSILKTLFAGGGDDVVVEVPENQIPGEKRKRGRPRRNPNPNSSPSLGAGGENVTKGIFVNGNNRGNVIKGILVNGNNVSEVERDRERVNGKGVEVDLGELAQLEDPYRGELERRSVGLRTEEEFLGFLGGLSGQWGSRRRKRRVVDAGEFGDALPRGWKLILSLKKKEGRVWVHVRRYIRFNYVAYTVRFSVMSF